ncbi:hypothetical protein R1sor_005248 [Riccia sorocarpa]|uniref:Uncharacterized protein n=1 Tax=Riccia sorocarpa TaxID=122646 RepID=A0ABD3HLZ8_9MARC
MDDDDDDAEDLWDRIYATRQANRGHFYLRRGSVLLPWQKRSEARKNAPASRQESLWLMLALLPPPAGLAVGSLLQQQQAPSQDG